MNICKWQITRAAGLCAVSSFFLLSAAPYPEPVNKVTYLFRPMTTIFKTAGGCELSWEYPGDRKLKFELQPLEKVVKISFTAKIQTGLQISQVDERMIFGQNINVGLLINYPDPRPDATEAAVITASDSKAVGIIEGNEVRYSMKAPVELLDTVQKGYVMVFEGIGEDYDVLEHPGASFDLWEPSSDIAILKKCVGDEIAASPIDKRGN